MIEGQSREFGTTEERVGYLKKMNKMHEKYADQEKKIGKMTEQ